MTAAMSMLHPLPPQAEGIPLPVRFTYPFCYTPHPLCVLAAGEVQAYLSTRDDWQQELDEGKMFGVLVVRTAEGRLGFLAAFSGILAGKNLHPYFVPPVYDLLRPDGFFKVEEEQISLINARIRTLEADERYLQLKAALADEEQAARSALDAAKASMKAAKARREERRKEAALTPDEAEALIRESQFQKAECKRLERSLNERLDALRRPLGEWEDEMARLKAERKQRSAALQLRLFAQFEMLNARGERKNLCDIFAPTAQQVPPAGAGECAAPKLLQQAYLHGWQPLCMAEFWWGRSPKTEVRHHGHYYPACQGKCGPILGHMLQGLDVDESPRLQAMKQSSTAALEIVYEDSWLAVVNKPAGMLSVPGKEEAESVYSLMRRRYPTAEGPLTVHRLDMDTSGLMLIAKTKEAHRLLQEQFRQRLVSKRYIALLEGNVPADKGRIDLPLCPDPLDRPRQLVHPVHGKAAITDYEVLERKDGRTLVAFYPHTGRTHQLRLHAAHPQGLHCPIVGDPLYGHPATRLCLHAETLEFTHPATGRRMRFCRGADF